MMLNIIDLLTLGEERFAMSRKSWKKNSLTYPWAT